MHFLLTALGSYGDVHPMMGLGAALRERGHEVELLASGYFEEEIRGCGLGFVPVGTREQYLELTRLPDLWHPRRSLRLIVKHSLKHFLESMYHQIAERYRPGETVIAAHGLDLASRVARDKLGVPVASVVYAPMALWSSVSPPKLPTGWMSARLPGWLNQAQFAVGDRLVLRPLVGPPVNRLRADLGLPPVHKLLPDWWYGSGCTLCLFPEWFAAPLPDWPPGTKCVGFPLWDGGDSRPLSEACQAFLAAGDAPIVFTPGTANRQGGAFFETAVEVCRRLGRRGLLLSKFDEHLPARMTEQVQRFDFEPLSRLLPHAAAFVHHGGIGSSSQALAAATPQLIRPLAFDQPDNAARLIALGVAESLSPRRFNRDRTAAALDRLMSSETVRENCDRAARRCDPLAAKERACEVLESLAK
jgi:rhamnosyltransferase subunit B